LADALARAHEIADNANTPPGQANSLLVDVPNAQVTFGGRVYSVEAEEAVFLPTIVKAGDWITSDAIFRNEFFGQPKRPNPTRLFRKLCAKVPGLSDIIECERGKGFRQRPRKL
jgi:hypothetical protein